MKKKTFLYGTEKAIAKFISGNVWNDGIDGVIIGQQEDERYRDFYSQLESSFDNGDNRLPEELARYDLKRDIDVIKSGRTIICQKGILGSGIEDLFDHLGLRYGEDYIYSAEAEAQTDKKTVILHGYFCFVRDLCIILGSSGEFREKYCLFAALYDESRKYPYCRALDHLVSKADVYIYNRESKNYYYAKSELPESCIAISMPCINFGAFHPQIIRKGSSYDNPLYIEPKGPNRVYRFGDKYINEMLLQGKTSQSIFEAVSNDDYLKRKDIEELFRREQRIMGALERTCDIKISGFVNENYKTHKLFPVCDHWTMLVAKEFAGQILDLLEVSRDSINIDEPPKRYTEVPIYPSVARALGIEWVNDTTVYRMRTGEEYRNFTFEEYVYNYCDVMRLMLAIKESW